MGLDDEGFEGVVLDSMAYPLQDEVPGCFTLKVCLN